MVKLVMPTVEGLVGIEINENNSYLVECEDERAGRYKGSELPDLFVEIASNECYITLIEEVE